MNEIKAPAEFLASPHPWIFLAGSIEMGKAVDWQSEVAKALDPLPGTILNPRRDDWDSSWEQSIDNPQFKRQVSWELCAQECADLIGLYLAPGTKSPISLLELGLFYQRELVVCCPEGFWRKGNVDIVCERYCIKRASSLDYFIELLCFELGKVAV